MDKMSIRSTNGMRTHLNALEAKGYIRRIPFAPKGIILRKDLRKDIRILKDIKSICLDPIMTDAIKVKEISLVCERETF